MTPHSIETSLPARPLRPLALLFSVSLTCAVLILIWLLPGAAVVSGAALEADKPKEMSGLPKAEKRIWDRAIAAREAGEDEKAIAWFYSLYERYPDSVAAEESLWWAAQTAKDLAWKSEKPDWQKVKELFHDYSVYYPDTARAPLASFEIGLDLYRLHAFREALSRFVLFVKKYPGSSLAPQAIYWQGKILIRVKRLDEAEKLFRKMIDGEGAASKNMGLVGMGYVLFAKERYLGALEIIKKVMSQLPSYHVDDPEILRVMGLSNMKVGSESLGRKQLFHYLNLENQSVFKTEILFVLAENFTKYKDAASARKLYEMVIASSEDEAKNEVVLSRFRLSLDRNDPKRPVPAWQEKKNDLADPAADRPYLDVLANFDDRPEAQEARYNLFQRYMSRQDFKNGFDIGKEYLQREGGKYRDEMSNSLGGILLRWVEELLAAGKYQEIYDLYRQENAYFSGYPQGRLLYLVGQALEALNLNDKAAVVYYRALRLPLTDAEKIDLYYRRARVYLAQKDLASADRLLTYIRQLYGDKKEGGEIFYLSGRLRQMQENFPEALDFYAKATEILTFEDQKTRYGQAYLEMLFETRSYDKAVEVLDRFRKDQWLAGEDLQRWYSRLGDILHRGGKLQEAITAFETALGAGMDQEKITHLVQEIHLHLGDIYLTMGDKETSRSHFEKCLEGDNQLLHDMALERLQHGKIEQKILDLGGFKER